MTTLITRTPQFLWFHAGAAALNDRAIWLLAPPGGGKSSLISLLVQQGGQYLSDDVVAFDLATSQLIGFPQTPRPRLVSKQWITTPEELTHLPKQTMHIEPASVRTHPCAIAQLIFPSYHLEQPVQLEPSPPGQAVLELLKNAMNFPHHQHRAMGILVELLRHVPAYHLRYDDRETAILQLL